MPLDSYSDHRYHLINNGTKLGNTSWHGRVVIGVEAIYIFKETLEQIRLHPENFVALVLGILYKVTEIFAQRAKPVLDILAGCRLGVGVAPAHRLVMGATIGTVDEAQ